jgi:uncharacterized membrane protein
MNFALAAATYFPSIGLPDGTELVLMLLRWIHFIAGITWIGLLYFFVLVNSAFLGELDANTRTLVIPKLLPRAMWWFRWSSVVTVLAGFAYWNNMVATDARSVIAMGGTASAGTVIGSFVVIWTLAFAVEMGVVMGAPPALKTGLVMGIVVAIVLVLAGYVFLSINQHGWESNRTLVIGIGGGLGWFMMFNVWGIVWRIQKKIIHWNTAALAEGTPIPPEAAQLSRISSLVARVNFWVSFPMLFFMGASSHYLVFTQP